MTGTGLLEEAIPRRVLGGREVIVQPLLDHGHSLPAPSPPAAPLTLTPHVVSSRVYPGFKPVMDKKKARKTPSVGPPCPSAPLSWPECRCLLFPFLARLLSLEVSFLLSASCRQHRQLPPIGVTPCPQHAMKCSTFRFPPRVSFWLHWAFAAAHRPSPVAASGGLLSSRGLCAARWGAWALEHRRYSSGAGVELPRGLWDLPGPGIKPVSLALAGRFLTSGPQGSPEIFKETVFSLLNSNSVNFLDTMNFLNK